VGTNPAVLAAHIAIQTLHPDLVINAGTAGGFMAKGGSVGDVYVSTCLRHHDRRIPIPGFDAYGRGEHTAFEVNGLVQVHAQTYRHSTSTHLYMSIF
jgi:5'-methylthioadenosine nucleosidase